jgi:hypothetical protein
LLERPGPILFQRSRFSNRPPVFPTLDFPRLLIPTLQLTNCNFSKSAKRKGGETGEEPGTEGKGAKRRNKWRILRAGEESEIGADFDLRQRTQGREDLWRHWKKRRAPVSDKMVGETVSAAVWVILIQERLGRDRLSNGEGGEPADPTGSYCFVCTNLLTGSTQVVIKFYEDRIRWQPDEAAMMDQDWNPGSCFPFSFCQLFPQAISNFLNFKLRVKFMYRAKNIETEK